MYLERRSQIVTCLARATGVNAPALADGGIHADFASTVAFDLARERKMPPAKIAEGLARDLSKDPGLLPVIVEAKGPYLNFHVPVSDLQEALREAIRPGYGSLSNISRAIMSALSTRVSCPRADAAHRPASGSSA